MKIKNTLIIALFIFCGVIQFVYSDIGTDLAMQSYYDLSALTPPSNRIAHNGIMTSGFYLLSNTVTCTFDSFYPVQGLINLDRGKLYLNRSMNCDSFTYFGTGGQIYGDGYAINFPKSTLKIGFPDSDATTVLGSSAMSSQAMGATVNGVSWSYDDKYVAGGAGTSASNLSVYSVSKGVLSVAINSITAGSSVTAVSWHHQKYYLAVGITNATNSISVYQWDGSTLTTQAADQKNLTTGVNTLAWSYDGKFLAVSYATGTSSAIQIYSYSGAGTLTAVGSPYVYGAPSDATLPNALSWHPNGNLLAVGVNNGSFGKVHMLLFNGTSAPTLGNTLTLGTNENIGGVYIKPFDFDNDAFNNSTCYLCVAITSGGVSNSKNRMYEYAAGVIQTTARYSSASEFKAFNTISWSHDGMLVVFGADTGSGTELRCYFAPENNSWYVSTSTYLMLLSAQDTASNVKHVRWAKTSNDYIVAAIGTNVSVYKINQLSAYRTFNMIDKTNLVLNSDMEFRCTTTFSGICTINGNGNKLFLNNELGNLNVASGGVLNIQDVELVGLKGRNLSCLANDASIVFENCKITVTSDYVFDTGSMLFNKDVIVSGTNKFIYSSVMSSTINSYSMLCFDKDMTFNYAPTVAKRDLIYMQDDSSWLVLDGSSLISTKTGLRLTRGRLFFDNLVTLSGQGSSTSEALCFGNGTVSGNLGLVFLSAAQVDTYGRVDYQCTN